MNLLIFLAQNRIWEKVLEKGVSAQLTLKITVYKRVIKYLFSCNEESRHWSKFVIQVNYFYRTFVLTQDLIIT